MLRFGMPGADGAIEAVHINDDEFVYQVIGDFEPEGICGSGLVDILAELRRVEWMTPEGRFDDGGTDYTIAPSRGITFSASDASQLAQAKASNASGQRILLRRLGLAADQVDHVFLAGGFANAIDIENAIAIGFLPRSGPSAWSGSATPPCAARPCCCSRVASREALSELIGRIEHIELETEPDFFDLFVDGCLFHPIPTTPTA